MTEFLTDIKDALLLFKIQKVIQKNKENINIYNRVIKIIINKTEDKDGNDDNNDQTISNKHKHKYKMILAENEDQDAKKSNN